MSRLLADIGGTNTRCAIVDDDRQLHTLECFENLHFDGLPALLADYVDSLPGEQSPDEAALAVAAPIRGDEIRMINIDWQFSAEALRRSLGLQRLHVLNDFEALALGLPDLAEDELVQIGGGACQAGKPKAVLGPGTGLGVASLIPTQSGWAPVSGEGGHVTLPAFNDREAAMIGRVREQFGHCSAERIVSGSGLELLHALVLDEDNLVEPATSAAEISARADAGDERAAETLEIFFELTATLAANLALTVGAFGGVYIGGGIIPRHAARFAGSGFRERFEAKGRYGDYLKSIPTFLIVAEHPTLTGLAAIQFGSGSGSPERV